MTVPNLGYTYEYSGEILKFHPPECPPDQQMWVEPRCQFLDFPRRIQIIVRMRTAALDSPYDFSCFLNSKMFVVLKEFCVGCILGS